MLKVAFKFKRAHDGLVQVVRRPKPCQTNDTKCHDDESLLRIDGRHVMWESLDSHFVFIAFEFENTVDVKDAKWICFDKSQNLHWLVVLVNQNSLTFFSPDGDQADVSLTNVHSMWVVALRKSAKKLNSEILIVERDLANKAASNLMFLAQPFDGFHPLIMTPDSEFDFGKIIFASSDRLGLIVSFNGEGRHLIWDVQISESYQKASSFHKSAYSHEESNSGYGNKPQCTLRRNKIYPSDNFLDGYGEANRIFTTSFAAKAETMYFLFSEKGILLGLDINTFSIISMQQNYVDAVPVVTGIDTIDILAIKQDGFIHLSRGLIPICKFKMNACLLSSTILDTNDVPTMVSTTDKGVLSLTSPFGARVTINMSNYQAIRLEVILTTSDQYTNDAIDALSLVLPTSELFALRAATLEISKYNHDVWNAFTLVVILFTSDWYSADFQVWECTKYYLDVLEESFFPVGEPSDFLDRFNDLGTNAQHQKNVLTKCVASILEDCAKYCCSKGPSKLLRADKVVKCLHALYEDIKLSTRAWHHVDRMAKFLYRVCSKNAFPGVLDYMRCYQRDCNSLPISTISSSVYQVKDIYHWLHWTITKGTSPYTLETLPEILPSGDKAPGSRARFVAQLFSSNCSSKEFGTFFSREHFLSCIVRNKIRIEDLSDFSPGVALYILDTLQHCRLEPNKDWSTEIYEFIGRPDLAVLANKSSETQSLFVAPNSSISTRLITQNLHQRLEANDYIIPSCLSQAQALHMEISNAALEANSKSHKLASLFDQSDPDGFNFVRALSTMRFTEANKLDGVCSLLRSSEPEHFHVTRSPEMTDHEYEKKKQSSLWLVCNRQCSYPLGRAMLTLGSIPPMIYAESLRIPSISMSGTILPANSLVVLDQAASAKLETWPSFHNGVASGLRLFSLTCPQYQNNTISSSTIPNTPFTCVTRNWILYNRGKTTLTHHAGFLFALGLLHHLNVLAVTDIYEYLATGHDPTTIGILLGMASSKDGSSDASISKMLCLHIPALLPQPFAEMDLTSAAQVAAIAGIGLLFRDTGNCLMAEFLLNELSHGQSTARTIDSESYALTAGLALGMVTVGMARSKRNVSLAALGIAQRLHDAFTCGRDVLIDKEHSLHAVTNTTYSQSFLSNRRPGMRVSRDFNFNVTASGAILAFGLYFAKSGSRTAALSLCLPEAQVLLERIRPDLLLLRVLARALILWDDVDPTVVWIETQLPTVVVYSMERLRIDSNEIAMPRVDFDSFRRMHANIIAGACLTLGIRYSGSGCSAAALTLRHYLGYFAVLRDTYIDDKERVQNGQNSSIAQGTFAKTLGRAADRASTAAAAVGIARELSTNQNELIVNECLSRAARPTMYAEALKLRPDRPTLETCLCATATALSIVMAGTGDVNSLRLLCELRQRIDLDATYGTHVALHMSIGLLFVGGGRASLMRADKALPALLSAFFPRYPHCANDNQYHLQALRHLWTLTIEWRGMEAVDADSGNIIRVPITIHFKQQENTDDQSEMVARTPCLLPPLDDIVSISINSEEFYSLFFDVKKNHVHHRLFRSMHMIVKRKNIHVDVPSSYDLKPFSRQLDLSASKTIQFFDTQKYMLLNKKDPQDRLLTNPFESVSEQFCFLDYMQTFLKKDFASLLNETKANHDFEGQLLIQLYAQLAEYVMNFETAVSSLQTWSLRLVLDYCVCAIESGMSEKCIVRPEIMYGLCMYLDSTKNINLHRATKEARAEETSQTNHQLHLEDCYRILNES